MIVSGFAEVFEIDYRICLYDWISCIILAGTPALPVKDTDSFSYFSSAYTPLL